MTYIVSGGALNSILTQLNSPYKLSFYYYYYYYYYSCWFLVNNRCVSVFVVYVCRQLKSVVDRDVLCARQDICRLEFDVVVGPADLFNIISINLTIHDINDHQPTFPADTPQPLRLTIAESAAAGTHLQLPVAAVDLDSPSLGVARYELFPVDVRSVFSVKWRPGTSDVRLVVRAGAGLDRESRDHYDVTLAAFDGGSPPLNGSMSLHVDIGDINDNAPVFERAEYTTQVHENDTAGL